MQNTVPSRGCYRYWFRGDIKKVFYVLKRSASATRVLYNCTFLSKFTVRFNRDPVGDCSSYANPLVQPL